jgi:hypothetical protein
MNNNSRATGNRTIIVDDAGSGDLLFGVIIGAYCKETELFKYGVVGVQYFQSPNFGEKKYLKEASKITFQLLKAHGFNKKVQIKICRSYIFDTAVEDIRRKHGDSQVKRIKVIGRPQQLTETAYLDELRNLGYEPIEERERRRAKSFFHMMRWIKKNPHRIKYAKTGWPRLSKYDLSR